MLVFCSALRFLISEVSMFDEKKARRSVQRAFLTKFDLDDFQSAPNGDPFKLTLQTWLLYMAGFVKLIGDDGFSISNAALAANATYKVALHKGVEILVQTIKDESAGA
jgi:hypothetical protein